jgi:hypothetical protein
MDMLLQVLQSGTFWTAFGSVATAVGVFWVIYKETRVKPGPDARPGQPRVPDKPKAKDAAEPRPSVGRITNREKIRACLVGHPEGATLEQIASETGIPIGSLSSDMTGRDAMGIEKQGYGKEATYRLKNGG